VILLNRAQFLAHQPDREVVFVTYEPHVFGPITIRHSVKGLTDDWFEIILSQELDFDSDNEAMDALANPGPADRYVPRVGATARPDLEMPCRDGCFEQDQHFLVWEDDDVRALVKRLERTIG